MFDKERGNGNTENKQGKWIKVVENRLKFIHNKSH